MEYLTISHSQIDPDTSPCFFLKMVEGSAAERSTLDLKPMMKGRRSPKQEQSVAPQNGLGNFFLNG